MHDPTNPGKYLTHRDGRGEDSLELMLENFVVLQEERLSEAECADWPCLVVAPHKKKNHDYTESTGKERRVHTGESNRTVWPNSESPISNRNRPTTRWLNSE